MSDDAELWGKLREESQRKRWSNDETSRALLSNSGITYRIMNASCSHYRIGDYDFWATTGLFVNRKTQERGRGVRNLIKLVKAI